MRERVWRMLCVEGDKSSAESMAGQLEDIPGAEVKTSVGLDCAKNMLTEAGLMLQPFDVVVSDAKMGEDYDGFDVLKFAKLMNPECILVLYSGLQVREHMAEVSAVTRLGNFAILQKPSEAGDLARLVEKKLEEREKCRVVPSRAEILRDIAGLEKSRAALMKFVHIEAGSRASIEKCENALTRKIEEKRRLLP